MYPPHHFLADTAACDLSAAAIDLNQIVVTFYC
jgi:hypothetical protein